MIPDLTRAGPAAIFGMLVALLPMGIAIAYAVKPRERLLALMRPLSLATIFAALHTLVFGPRRRRSTRAGRANAVGVQR
jgi:hypothetical protein